VLTIEDNNGRMLDITLSNEASSNARVDVYQSNRLGHHLPGRIFTSQLPPTPKGKLVKLKVSYSYWHSCNVKGKGKNADNCYSASYWKVETHVRSAESMARVVRDFTILGWSRVCRFGTPLYSWGINCLT